MLHLSMFDQQNLKFCSIVDSSQVIGPSVLLLKNLEGKPGADHYASDAEPIFVVLYYTPPLIVFCSVASVQYAPYAALLMFDRSAA